MIFEKVVYLVAILAASAIFGCICFLAGVLHGERNAERKSRLDTFVIQSEPVEKVRLSASVVLPDGIDQSMSERILAERLAEQFPKVWKLEKEYDYDVRYTAQITVIPEGWLKREVCDEKEKSTVSSGNTG